MALASCSDDPPCDGRCVEPTPVSVRMDFAATGDFFASPFPNDARRDPTGKPIVEGFPNPQAVFLVDRVLDVIRSDADGFGVSSGVFFSTTGAIDAATLPTIFESVSADASVFLMSIDSGSPDYAVRYPVSVRFSEDPGFYGPLDMLSVVPLQGAPLRPRQRYGVFVTTRVHSAAGEPIATSDAVRALLAGKEVAGMANDAWQNHRDAIDAAAADAATPVESIAALSVFTTGDPAAKMQTALVDAQDDVMPPSDPFVKVEEFPTFCVYESSIEMPVYQAGDPPYSDAGGGWQSDTDGHLLFDHYETARFFVTIPKIEMPAAGYPLVVFSRTGAGGDRPLVDRGVRAEPGGESVTPGTGPALELAAVGYAGASIDGPHGGIRNVTGEDEQFLVFNFENPLALRDNIRQSALELALVPGILQGVSIDVADCVGASAPLDSATIDSGTLAIMGHSMGASIAPLALVIEPRFRAILLSGAGGSFLQNLLFKLKPIPVKPLAELILGLTTAGYTLNEEDPMLSMLQWAGEPADAPIYGRYVVREPLAGAPRHVLMMQGIVDHYIMPPIANAASLSFGLDLAGAALDGDAPELADLAPLASLLPLVGRSAIALPASGNNGGAGVEMVTAVVTQNPEDGIEDGHEVVYQTEGPKHAYRCFLASLKSGTPIVPAPGTGADCE